MAASPRIAHTFPPRPSLELRVEQVPTKTKQKFDAEFLDRRMREFHAMQEQMEAELEYDIIREVLNAFRKGARQ